MSLAFYPNLNSKGDHQTLLAIRPLAVEPRVPGLDDGRFGASLHFADCATHDQNTTRNK